MNTSKENQNIESEEEKPKTVATIIFVVAIVLFFLVLARFGILVSIILILVAMLYFLPTFVAYGKEKRNSLAIFALNLCLGWTLLGWVIALIWSLTYEKNLLK